MAEEYFEEVWEQQMMEENHLLGYTWIKNLYWKLEEVSCVLILRNKKWFQDNIHTLKELWDIILSERESGYEHRAPNKRVKKDVGLIVDKIEISGCLINTDKIKNNINMDMGKTSMERAEGAGERRIRSNSEIETETVTNQNITPELYHNHIIIISYSYDTIFYLKIFCLGCIIIPYLLLIPTPDSLLFFTAVLFNNCNKKSPSSPSSPDIP